LQPYHAVVIRGTTISMMAEMYCTKNNNNSNNKLYKDIKQTKPVHAGDSCMY